MLSTYILINFRRCISIQVQVEVFIISMILIFVQSSCWDVTVYVIKISASAVDSPAKGFTWSIKISTSSCLFSNFKLILHLPYCLMSDLLYPSSLNQWSLDLPKSMWLLWENKFQYIPIRLPNHFLNLWLVLTIFINHFTTCKGLICCAHCDSVMFSYLTLKGLHHSNSWSILKYSGICFVAGMITVLILAWISSFCLDYCFLIHHQICRLCIVFSSSTFLTTFPICWTFSWLW